MYKNKLYTNTKEDITPSGKYKITIEKTISNFDNILKELPTPAIEFGGPTYDKYKHLLDANKLQNIIITNIKQVIICEYKKLNIDLLVDATNMPFKNKSIGTVLFSRLNNEEIYQKSNDNKHYRYQMIQELNNKAIDEAYRVLKKDGILIYQGYFEDNIQYAINKGFDMIKFVRIQIENEEIPYIGAIFIKSNNN